MKKLKKKRKQRRPELIQFDKAWSEFSRYIRKSQENCFTCGKWIPYEKRNAGHFKHGKLDFDEMNIHMQCIYCNQHQSGKLDVYAEKLIEMYGLDKFKELIKRSNILHKYNLKELIKITNQYEKKNRNCV